jgi:hypothetical protein
VHDLRVLSVGTDTRAVVGKYEGVMIPKNGLYKFTADESENLVPPSSPLVRMASCGRYARVRAHLPAFPMIQTLRETTRCAWTEMAWNGSKQC